MSTQLDEAFGVDNTAAKPQVDERATRQAAEEESQRSGLMDKLARAAEFLLKMDTNRNAYLDFREVRAGVRRAGGLAKANAMLDLNDDGEVSIAERKTINNEALRMLRDGDNYSRSDGRPRRGTLMESVDTDKDGRLSKEEATEVLKRMDRDEDGKVTLQEANRVRTGVTTRMLGQMMGAVGIEFRAVSRREGYAVVPDGQEEAEQPRRSRTQDEPTPLAADKDGNGKLSREEAVDMLQAMDKNEDGVVTRNEVIASNPRVSSAQVGRMLEEAGVTFIQTSRNSAVAVALNGQEQNGLVDSFDKDRNGLDKAEATALLTSIDANQDGKVTIKEVVDGKMGAEIDKLGQALKGAGIAFTAEDAGMNAAVAPGGPMDKGKTSSR